MWVPVNHAAHGVRNTRGVWRSAHQSPRARGCIDGLRRSGPRALVRASAGHSVVMPYDPTIYWGAAAHYWRGRPAYSPQLEAALADEVELDGSGRLLDVGCGPGILTVRLATLFEEAVGLDPDPAMLAEARRVAEKRGITNIRWVQAPAEELPCTAPGPFRLVSFGTSFHWT